MNIVEEVRGDMKRNLERQIRKTEEYLNNLKKYLEELENKVK